MALTEPPQGMTFPELEEEVLQFWKDEKIFEQSVSNREGASKWTFLDGPPFITGVPHYGSLLSSLPKDVFPRYWTMKGYQVERVWGWDCHGLPAENKVENELGIKTKLEIETKVGVKKFIEACKAYVSRVSGEWEWYVDHVGRWVDFQNAYRTMDTPYMESVMWVFKQMYDKGYIYKGLRVSLFCPHCSTPISNFEVAMDGDENYKEVNEPANVYKYELESEKGTYFLAWSTTPWNKIVTPALAVNPKLNYVKVKQTSEYYILAETTLKILKDEPYEVVEKIKGEKLLGMKFVPHYDFYAIEEGKRAFEIIGGDFVTADEGTGIVTIAAYGEDDLAVMKKNNIQITLHVDEVGHLKDFVPNWGGMYYLKVNQKVNEDLASQGLVYREDPHLHRVPHCWRCHTRLMHAPQDAWFVDVEKLKPLMEKTNAEVNWFPGHFKNGRFLKSLQSAPDWCISRSRYWGSPVPVWECGCGERTVPGSIAELEELSGEKITDLHKPEIDEVVVKCRKCGQDAHRVKEVLDSWIEAGSASFAERHYPFVGEKDWREFFPPDFISEYTGQIRAWFYVMHVIGAALYETKAFKNVIVTGVIAGTDGRKMSKNYGNYPDPKLMLTTHGGDAFRLYLLGSPVMNGEDIRVSELDYRNWVKNYMLILWNSYKYFLTYANLNDFDRQKSRESDGDSVLDKWILSRLWSTHLAVQNGLESLSTTTAVSAMSSFVDDLSTWYIRRSRDRVSGTDENDKMSFLSTLYQVLVTFSHTSAPVTPFISEYVYRNLTDDLSVHLNDWPGVQEEKIDKQLEEAMTVVRFVVEKGHAERKRTNIPVRQPLSRVIVNSQAEKLSAELCQLIAEELNVKEVEWQVKEGKVLEVVLDEEISEELKAEGEARDLIRKIQVARKEAKCDLSEVVDVELPNWPKSYEEPIKQATKARKLIVGDVLRVVRI